MPVEAPAPAAEEEPVPLDEPELPVSPAEFTIHERMVAILSELPAIGKGQYNTQQKFHFRGHDDVLNALNPLLSKHGVYPVPFVLDRVVGERTTGQGKTMYEVNLHVRYRLYGAGGDYIEASAWGEGTDMGDKSTNKAMTMAFKNVLAQAFAVSTEESYDTDGLTNEETTRGGGGSRSRGGGTQPSGPAWDAPKDWAGLAERFVAVLGTDEAPEWLGELATLGYSLPTISAVVNDPETPDERKRDLWQRLLLVLRELEGQGDLSFHADAREVISKAFAGQFLALAGPDWALSPKEAETHPQKAALEAWMDGSAEDTDAAPAEEPEVADA